MSYDIFCNQCGYKWKTKKQLVKCCPKCKRYDWNEINKSELKDIEEKRGMEDGE